MTKMTETVQILDDADLDLVTAAKGDTNDPDQKKLIRRDGSGGGSADFSRFSSFHHYAGYAWSVVSTVFGGPAKFEPGVNDKDTVVVGNRG
ncbi:MAG: hypothetical protein AAFR17_00315 [Pseudomonadota bacterium]